MNIQILVKHYKFTDLTCDCIVSLKRSDLHGATITVIDSSNDFKYMCQMYDVNHEVISNDIGLIESFNRFINKDADIVIELNNDVYVHPQWLTAILKVFENKKIGIVAPMYSQPDGAYLYFPCPYKPQESEWEKYLNDNLPRPGTFAIHNHVDNCAWSFTKELINKIGLPDGNFKGAGWGANLDYCYRARKAGFLVASSSGSYIYHNHRGTYGKIDPNYVENAMKQRDEYLTEKYGNPGVVW